MFIKSTLLALAAVAALGTTALHLHFRRCRAASMAAAVTASTAATSAITDGHRGHFGHGHLHIRHRHVSLVITGVTVTSTIRAR